MYKISDFSSEVLERTTKLFRNHLFLVVFVFFIVLIGTFGIWVKPVLVNENLTWQSFINSFDSLSLVSFSLPLLVTLIFDKIVSVFSKPDKVDIALTIWLSVLFLVATIVITLLFTLGYKHDRTHFSWYSFWAWILVLYVWILGNVNNPNYQNNTSLKGPSGGDEVSRASMGGK